MFWSNPVNAKRLNEARRIAINIGHHDKDMDALLLQNGIRKNDRNYNERMQTIKETTMCAFQILREIRDLRETTIDYTIRDPKPARMAKLQREFLQLINARPCWVNVHAQHHIMTNHSLLLLHETPKTGIPELIEPLLAAGAEVDAVAPRTQQTALTYAIRNSNLAMVNLLLKAGANPNGVPESDTPLAIAVNHKNPEIIYALCAAGADPNLPVCEGRDYHNTPCTPLDLTYSHRDKATVIALIQCGANPNRGHKIMEELAMCYIRDDDVGGYLQTLIDQGSSLVHCSMANSLARAATGYFENKLPHTEAMANRMRKLVEQVDTHWNATNEQIDTLPQLREQCASAQQFAAAITPQHFTHAASIDRLDALLAFNLWQGAEKELMDRLTKLPPWLSEHAIEVAPWIGTLSQPTTTGKWTAQITKQRIETKENKSSPGHQS